MRRITEAISTAMTLAQGPLELGQVFVFITVVLMLTVIAMMWRMLDFVLGHGRTRQRRRR